MVAEQGAVCFADLEVNANTRFSDVWLQLYEEEIFQHTFGSAIHMAGNNVPLTVVLNSTFSNAFSDQGAAISIQRGGAIYCKDCRFRMDKKYTNYDHRQDDGSNLLEDFALLKDLNWERKEYTNIT